MLQKNKSGKMMYAKFIFIIPILVAFVMTFNTKVIAQEKKVEKYEVRTNVEVEMITKDFQKSDLETLKANLLKKGINLSYKKLKYNDHKEIIGIQLNVSNKQNNKAQIAQSGTAPIKPISIKFDDKGALALGNMKGMEGHDVFFSTDSDNDGNNIFIRKLGEGSETHNENFVWVSKDGEQTEVKVTNGKKVIIKTQGANEWEEKVWVTKSGDTTEMQKIKVIEIDEENDGDQTVIIKKVQKDGKDGKEVEVTVKKIGESGKGANKMMFISEDGEQPLMIVDGKEMEGGSLGDIDPETIETVNVYKGDKAIEKYGEKGKNGVVVISTKK